MKQNLVPSTAHGHAALAPLTALALVTLAFTPSCFAALTQSQRAQLPPPASRTVDFARDIQPILEVRCIKCHGRGKSKGGLSLESRDALLKGGDNGPAVTSGDGAGSYLIELTSGLNPDTIMPLKGTRLTTNEVGLLRAWIDQGLTWDQAVSFAKAPPRNLLPRLPALPPATPGSENPVDRLLEPYWTAHGVQPKAVVDDSTFARRAYLDIVGLLPNPEEQHAFYTDPAPNKRQRLVEALLGDKARYAEHWLTVWNDVLRNDYRGTGYIDGGRKQITSWLYKALATNLPYNQFVAQLINPSDESEGFSKGIIWRGTVNSSQTPQMQAAQNISQIFMGVNLKCASCHDSFINDWALADAYGMAGVYADSPLEMFECDKPTGHKARIKFLYDEVGAIDASASMQERKKRLAELLTQPQNGRFTRTIVNRIWAKFIGRGLVEPVDDMEQPAWNPDLLDWLAEDLAAHGYDLKRTMLLILTSRAYQLPAASLTDQTKPNYLFTGPAVRRMSAEQFRDALAQVTGVWYDRPDAEADFTLTHPAEPAPASVPQSVQWIWNTPDASTKALPQTVYLRKTLTLDAVPEECLALVACDNSYTLHLNGQKVRSGKNHTKPDLVDLLPFLRPGTNVFAIAAANHTPDNKPPDPARPALESDANPAGLLLYARFHSQGNETAFGTDASWVWSLSAQEGWEKPEFSDAEWKAAQALGPATGAPWHLGDAFARALGVMDLHGKVRSSLVSSDPLMAALGRPPRDQVTTTRPSAATTLQTLELTNGGTLSRILSQGAEKLASQSHASAAELAQAIFAQALGRPPNPAEAELARQFLGSKVQKEPVEDFLWAVAMLPEFQLIY